MAVNVHMLTSGNAISVLRSSCAASSSNTVQGSVLLPHYRTQSASDVYT